MVLLWLLTSLLLDAAVCQYHHLSNVVCYTCNAHSHKFPSCLTNTQHTCRASESCAINYDANFNVSYVGCAKFCLRAGHPTVGCPHGGNKIGTKCYACCKDSSCTRTLTSFLSKQTTAPASRTQLQCPNHCDTSAVNNCMQNARTCSHDQFCQITVLGNTNITGTCKGIDQYFHCLDLRYHRPCRNPIPNHPDMSFCYLGCYNSNTDLSQQLSKAISSTAPPTPSTAISSTIPTTTSTPTTTPIPTTTPMPSVFVNSSWTPTIKVNTSSQWNKVRTVCKSNTEDPVCSMLNVTLQISCTDSYTMRLCPETCALCQAINNTNCHDTVSNGGCTNLQTTQNICQSNLALQKCPFTCGLCAKIIDDMLDSKFGSAASSISSGATG